MPSSLEPAKSAAPPRHARWNARVHYYLGLYLLFFIWLFALTGLLLNHGHWGMADFQRSRATSKSEQRVSMPETGNALADARELMRQLGITGEIQWLGTPAQSNRFDFRVTRPGRNTEVRVDLTRGMATVEATQANALLTVRVLHVFTGVRLNDAKNERDWLLTSVWAFAMDAVAVGLLVVTASGLWIWLQTGAKRVSGTVALGAGIACCVWFLVGVAAFGQ